MDFVAGPVTRGVEDPSGVVATLKVEIGFAVGVGVKVGAEVHEVAQGLRRVAHQIIDIIAVAETGSRGKGCLLYTSPSPRD